jgi:peptide/nickel transport system permease protein
VLRFVLRRLAGYLTVVVVGTSLGYLLAASALDPRATYDAMQPRPSEAAIDQALSDVNMNPANPPLLRLGRWARGIVTHADLGLTVDHRSINDEVGPRVWVSVRLLLVATLVGSGLGIAIGAFSATQQHRWTDQVITFLSLVVLSVPVFVLAVAMKQPVIAFNDAVGVPVLYLQGEYKAGGGGWSWDAVVDRIQHLAVPCASLALGMLALFSRFQRATMIDVLGTDFLRLARAKGLRRRQVVLRHGLRIAVIPMATLFSYRFAVLFVGAILTEKIFGWHGVGEFFVDAINRNDINSVAAVVFLSVVMVALAGAVADVAHTALDPRVRRAWRPA